MSNEDKNTLGSTTTVLLFSALIISEIACLLMVLDYGFMGIFVFAEEDKLEKKYKGGESVSLDSSSSLFMQPLQLRLTMKDISILYPIHSKKLILGKIFRAKYQERTVFLRKISFTRLSTYVLEEFSSELDSYIVDNKNILPIVGVILDLPVICILTPFIEPGSLYKILHVDRAKLSLNKKIDYMIQVANAFYHIHSTERVHSHLTSENILINNHDRVLISDLGLKKIKKYAGIVFGYCNKSG